jgi:hypothetical protein
MDEEINDLVIGVIFLILIINMTMLISITTSIYGPDPGQPVFPAPTSSFPVFASSAVADPPDLLISLMPAIVPLVNQGAPLPDTNVIVSGQGPGASIKSVSSYVTIEAKETPEVVRHTCIQPEIPQRNETGYVTIYALSNQTVSQVLPIVSFSLLNPPLVIDYSLIPADARDIKYIEYKEISTLHEELIVLDRPYEDAWFTITVRNKDTGQLVTEDGFGRTYSFQSPRRLVVRESGNYSIECAGDYATINLTIKVKPEGNFP